MADTLPEHVRALLENSTYPYTFQGDVGLIQTHVSYVFLAGDQVFKLKKPVDFGFIDYSTLPKRRTACEAEVRLNLRGCPEIYLGVLPVVQQRDGRYRLGGRGRTVDYAVHMKRLPQGRMMDELLARDAVDLPMIGRLAARLAEFHEAAEHSAEITHIGGRQSFARNWRDNLERVQAFTGRTLSQKRMQRISEYADAFLQDESALLKKRDEQGWIRDCHGDLRSDAVCFDESLSGGIGFVDCIEFNDRLRYTDTALDVSFLAMDLDFRGRPDLSDLFAGFYATAMADVELPLLLRAYKCYRAGVRGLVESLTLDRPEVGASQKAGAWRRARAYFALAEDYTRTPQRQGIVLTMGLSGSGKSVLAGALAARLGAVLLSTDVVRRELLGKDGSTQRDAIDAGRYAQEQREEVYKALIERAGAYLQTGRPVVLDGTFIERRQRQRAIDLAVSAETPLLVVECRAPEDVVRERQERREGEGWTASEGRWEVYLAQKKRYEAPDEVPVARRVEVDTTAPLEDQIGAVMERLGNRRRR